MGWSNILFLLILVNCLDVQAENPHPEKYYFDNYQVSLKFNPPTLKKQNPVSTGAGGRRGQQKLCTARTQPPLTAIQPSNSVVLTTRKSPVLYIYIPENTANLLELRVLDERGNSLAKQPYKAPDRAGIYGISLPNTATLDPGIRYHWKIALVCQDKDRSQDDFVTGEIERVVLSTSQRKKLEDQFNPQSKAMLYAQYGLWNEILDNLSNGSRGVSSDWRELLKSIGIKNEEILRAPFYKSLDPR